MTVPLLVQDEVEASAVKSTLNTTNALKNSSSSSSKVVEKGKKKSEHA